MEHNEGDIADGPNGEVATFTNGKWVVQGAPPKPKSTWEDIKNIAPSALTQGTASLLSTPRALTDSAIAGGDWLMSKFVPEEQMNKYREAREAKKTYPEIWPTQSQIMGGVEKVTGNKFDEQAETPVGQFAQTALEIAPSMATGPQSLIRKGLSTLGAAAGSEGGGYLAGKINEDSPKLEAALRVAGGILGTHAPSMGRRAATPMPRDVNEAAKVRELDQALAPHGSTTRAGQVKGPNWINTLEEDNANSIATPGRLTPAKQQSAFGQFAQNEAGAPAPPGSFASRGITEPNELGPHMRRTGQGIEDLYSTARIPNLDPQLMARTSQVFQNATPQTRAQLTPITDRLTFSPSPIGTTNQQVVGKPGYLVGPNTTTPGPQWRQMENEVGQMANTASGTRDTQTAAALRQYAQALKQTAERATPGLAPLRENYTNAKALEIARDRAGGTAAANQPPMPHDVFAALGATKNPAATSNRLGRISDTAGQYGIGAPIKDPGQSRFAHDATSALVGAALGGGGQYLGGGGGVDFPILGSIIGGSLAAKARANPLTAALLMNPLTQKLLKNNRFQPGGRHTGLTHDPAARFALGAPHHYPTDDEE